jgi:hypothetical protein
MDGRRPSARWRTIGADAGHGGGDAVSALVALLEPDGRLSGLCGLLTSSACTAPAVWRTQSHPGDPWRRGGLTLTEIPTSAADAGLTKTTSRGSKMSTRDREAEAHSFTDPLLRSGSACTASRAPSEDDLAREVHRYALLRLPQEPVLVMAAAGGGGSGIIEID